MASIAPPKGAKPPDKGSFPLDHGGECKPQMKVLRTSRALKTVNPRTTCITGLAIRPCSATLAGCLPVSGTYEPPKVTTGTIFQLVRTSVVQLAHG